MASARKWPMEYWFDTVMLVINNINNGTVYLLVCKYTATIPGSVVLLPIAAAVLSILAGA